MVFKVHHTVNYRLEGILPSFDSAGMVCLFTEKLIFLVSGGRPDDANNEIMRAIVNGNKKVSFKAVISVFVINSK